MKKKALSLLLMVVMIAGLIPVSTAQAASGLENFTNTSTYDSGKFSDVSEKDWFSSVVASAYEMGLMKGDSESTFNPKGNITVAETIALAARLHNIYNGGNGKFTQDSPWYQVYVDYALENKIIHDTYRDYNAKISRANFVFILVKALPDTALPAINDIADGALPDVADDYKANSIYTLYRAGVLTGNDEFGTFNPDSTISRAEVAAIVTRMADSSQRRTFTLIKKTTVDAEIYFGALGYADSFFVGNYGISLLDFLEQDIGNGLTGGDMLKEQAFGLIEEFEAVRMFALDNGFELTDADRKELEVAKANDYEAAGGRAAFVAELNASGVNEKFYDYVAESSMYYGKVEGLFDVDAKYGMTSESIAEVISENYIRVKHILIQDNSDDEEKKALADKLLQRISNGEDFEKLLEEYGEDPGMTAYPDGYLIDGEGYTPEGTQMISEFTEASFALQVGDVSAVVPTNYGFHIIKRYPVDEAFMASYIAENNSVFRSSAYTAKLLAYMDNIVITNRAELEAFDIRTVLQN